MSQWADTNKASILVVDDTPANLQLLSETLGAHGFRTRAALSGKLAIRAARAEAPDLILLDIGMPEMNGFEVCSELKSDPALKDVPVIFISGLDETIDKVRAFAVGGVDYVTKPFEFEEVLARVETHLRLSRALAAEHQLAELRSRFISMASHEFRTPLTTILSSAEMLEHYGDSWPAEKRLKHLGRIETAAATMAALLEDVLVLGRATSGKLVFVPAATDLEALCRDVVDAALLAAGGERAISLDSACDSRPRVVDERLVRQILDNLVSNAVKYSSADSAVSVALSCSDDLARFTVADSGIGIPAEDIAHLTEAFHRGSNVAEVGGTGLGMTVVQQALELHGGTMSIESQVGVGTTVRVELPAPLPETSE